MWLLGPSRQRLHLEGLLNRAGQSPDSTFAAFVEADELAEDLLVLLADGLTEERLVALLKRWSKAWTRKPSGGPKGMDQLD